MLLLQTLPHCIVPHTRYATLLHGCLLYFDYNFMSATCCVQPRTCSNMQPVTSPNTVKFSCVIPGKDLVFNPAAANAAPPSLDACCKVRVSC